jgi:hypothetical protein
MNTGSIRLTNYSSGPKSLRIYHSMYSSANFVFLAAGTVAGIGYNLQMSIEHPMDPSG